MKGPQIVVATSRLFVAILAIIGAGSLSAASAVYLLFAVAAAIPMLTAMSYSSWIVAACDAILLCTMVALSPVQALSFAAATHLALVSTLSLGKVWPLALALAPLAWIATVSDRSSLLFATSSDTLLSRLAIALYGAAAVVALWTVLREETHSLLVDALEEERKRVARDLHDGPMQPLIAAGMHLGVSEWSSDAAPVRDALAAAERELRTTIADLDPRKHSPKAESRLTRSLNLFAALVRHQWGAEVDIHLDGLAELPTAQQRREVRQLVRESVSNAARHAAARHIRVEVAGRSGEVHILVKNDGNGFPFHGRRSLADLKGSPEAPLTLVERVSALSGRMSIESTSSGSEIEIVLPMAGGAA